jgi:copper homeostasis protein
MAGSGVNEENVHDIVQQTGVQAIHFSARSIHPSSMEYRNPFIAAMGSEEGSEYQCRTVDAETVKRMRSLAQAVQH